MALCEGYAVGVGKARRLNSLWHPNHVPSPFHCCTLGGIGGPFVGCWKNGQWYRWDLVGAKGGIAYSEQVHPRPPRGPEDVVGRCEA